MGASFIWYDTDLTFLTSWCHTIPKSNRARGRDHVRPAFFWYDNDSGQSGQHIHLRLDIHIRRCPPRLNNRSHPLRPLCQGHDLYPPTQHEVR